MDISEKIKSSNDCCYYNLIKDREGYMWMYISSSGNPQIFQVEFFRKSLSFYIPFLESDLK